MTTVTHGIEVKNKGSLIFGIILLLTGSGAYIYKDTSSPYRSDWSYPFQTLGIVLLLAGIVFIALGFFYSPRKTN